MKNSPAGAALAAKACSHGRQPMVYEEKIWSRESDDRMVKKFISFCRRYRDSISTFKLPPR